MPKTNELIEEEKFLYFIKDIRGRWMEEPISTDKKVELIKKAIEQKEKEFEKMIDEVISKLARGLANSFEEYKSKVESSEPSDNKNLTKDCPICGFPKEGKNS